MSDADERGQHLPGCDRRTVHAPGGGSCSRRGVVLLEIAGDPLPGPLENTGILAYDLQLPAPPGRAYRYTPLRQLGQVPPRPRYTAPPVPDGHVRVELDLDDLGEPVWRPWDGTEASYPARIFDVPAGQFQRWEQARTAYESARDEVSALRAARLATPGWAPPGWTEKPSYQVQP